MCIELTMPLSKEPLDSLKSCEGLMNDNNFRESTQNLEIRLEIILRAGEDLFQPICLFLFEWVKGCFR